MNWSLMAFLAAVLLVATVSAQAGPEIERRAVVVRVGREAGAVEKNAARLLVNRLLETGQVQARVEVEGEGKPVASDVLLVLLGRPEHHAEIGRIFTRLHIPPLSQLAPGPEGFLMRTLSENGRTAVLAAGVDDRGVVYAVGEFLRRAEIRTGGLQFPTDLDLRTAPAFEVRGTQIGQSGVMLEKAHGRPWTQAEREHATADIILAGANTIQVSPKMDHESTENYRYLKSLGIKTLVHFTPNEYSGGPPAWQAKESIGRPGYLCPSVPAARAALLKNCEETFKNSPDIDYVRLVGGDGGGCECDLCKPFGGVFIRLCEDCANIIHKYHPKTEIFITNQKFENASDEAIFKYLQEKPRTWLRAFCYGPGSDAMSWQPGHRQTHRMDLFRYPGFGPPSRYLHEILHQLPPQQDLVFFNEITHWRYSEFGYAQAYPRSDKNGDLPPHWGHFMYERMPDRYLTLVYDRLSFFAWPRFYHRMFGETVRYGIGDVTHSSGTQDHFNQWMWQRLLWDPQRGVEDVVDEYSRAWFGRQAAPYMSKAVFQIEQNMQDDPAVPLPQKKGVDAYYRLVKTAGELMPPYLQKRSWLWREHMQKAAIEKHTALAVGKQMALERRVEARVASALKAGDLDAAIRDSLRLLDQKGETPQMRALREEATRVGEESNALYGLRSEGIYSLDHDFIGLGWTRRQLERAKAAPAEKRREMLSMIADYENPGEGGYYDNCGTVSPMPHLVHGSPYDYGQPLVSGMLAESNRHSQRTMASTQDDAKGVAFHYEHLDPNAHYEIRVTLVGPKYQGRYAERMNQHAESIYANDIPVVKGQTVPQFMSDYYTFDIPREATKTGDLTIRFEKMPDVASGDRVSVEQWRNTGGWGTIVSEIWLIKKR